MVSQVAVTRAPDGRVVETEAGARRAWASPSRPMRAKDADRNLGVPWG